MEAHRSRKRSALMFGGLIVLLILGLLVPYGLEPGHAVDKHNSASTSTKSHNSTLTAGGLAVPAALQARAKSLGYYCPSWNSAPGEASSGLCLPLDK